MKYIVINERISKQLTGFLSKSVKSGRCFLRAASKLAKPSKFFLLIVASTKLLRLFNCVHMLIKLKNSFCCRFRLLRTENENADILNSATGYGTSHAIRNEVAPRCRLLLQCRQLEATLDIRGANSALAPLSGWRTKKQHFVCEAVVRLWQHLFQRLFLADGLR
jgi:hypothetical protein